MTTSTPSTSDHILSSSNTSEATEMLQNLSLGSPKKSLQVVESTREKKVPVQYVPIERSVSPFVDPGVFYHPNASFSPDFMDPNMFYNTSGYPSQTYYYGGNEWDRYVSPDGGEMAQGVYGDYPHSYAYMSYGTYTPSGATLGHDGHLYEAQHYQYPTSYVHPSNMTRGPNTSSLPKTGQAEVSTSGVSNPLHLPADTAKGNHGIVENVMTNRTKLSKTFSSTFQNPSGKSNDFYGSASFLPASSGISPAVPYGNYRPSRKNQNLQPSNGADFRSTRVTSGMEQGGYVNKAYPNNRICYENTHGGDPGYLSSSYYPGINSSGWLTVDNKYKSRTRSNDVSGYGKETLYGLNELNKGPRTSCANYENPSERVTLAVKGLSLPLRGSNGASLPIFPDREQCNKVDFPETYSDARFFVIKSYSEDDVHKSIKYGVWTSTASGNKKLDGAYKEAQGKSGGCPVFLFFSVNASGQFVGLAEMVGPVEFDRTVDYWQQDKWNGCFPVKWHIIKDVPNSLLRHIKLENNENKPVTNSRDTQEVRFEQGIQVLKIFKSHSSKTCILDDFEFYEGREKVMLEKKARHQLSNKQGSLLAASVGKQRPMGVQQSNEPSQLSSDLSEDTIALVSSGSGMAKVSGELKLLGDNSLGARVGDTSDCTNRI